MEKSFEPLAVRMRPQQLEDIIGQDKILGPGKILNNFIINDDIPSMILWGPPGIGKTTIASVIAKTTKSRFIRKSLRVGSCGQMQFSCCNGKYSFMA